MPASRQQLFLREECPDPAIRAEVEAPLRDSGEAEAFFDAAIREVAASLNEISEPLPGDTIGVYRLLSFIGRGGMGTVYLARRIDGAFDQLAAVKVVQTSNGPLLSARLQQERQILAMLNHPNIARIVDGGETSAGLPFFVMEYVPGRPIDEYCSRRKLSQRDILELFLKACEAVLHAHQNLVIHRDLKPANILVTGRGEPKLLDFGIAKILDSHQGKTISTGVHTPAYASPEQIRGDAVATTTDIYSLGAILYKLLTGSSLNGNDHGPVLLPPDLHAIVGKATHSEADRRYRSVEELEQDIRRYLGGHPVLARPDSLIYRAGCFIRRHALLAAMVCLAVLSLLIGSAVSLHHARTAERRFQQVRQLANIFLFDFDRAIQNVAGTLEARRLVASTARNYLEQLAADADDAGLRREVAEAYQRLAEIQRELQLSGSSNAEIDSLRKAYEIRRDLGDDRSSEIKPVAGFIRLASRLAGRYQVIKNAAEAERWDEEATSLVRRHVLPDCKSPELLDAARAAYLERGLRLETAGKAGESRKSMETAVQFAERAREADPGNRDLHHNLVTTEFTIANMLLNLKDLPAALQHAQKAVAISEQLHDLAPHNAKWRRGLQQSLSSAGIIHRAMAKSEEKHLPAAVSFLQKAHSLAEEAVREDPKNRFAKDDLVVQCHRLARALGQSAEFDGAAQLYEQAGHVIQERIRMDPHDRRSWYLSAANQVNHGRLLLEQGRAKQGRSVLLSADQPFERALALDALDATLLELRASQLYKLAEAGEKLGDLPDARGRMHRCVEILAGMIGRDPLAKDYVDEYGEMLGFSHRLGVSTAQLPRP